VASLAATGLATLGALRAPLKRCKDAQGGGGVPFWTGAGRNEEILRAPSVCVCEVDDRRVGAGAVLEQRRTRRMPPAFPNPIDLSLSISSLGLLGSPPCREVADVETPWFRGRGGGVEDLPELPAPRRYGAPLPLPSSPPRDAPAERDALEVERGERTRRFVDSMWQTLE